MQQAGWFIQVSTRHVKTFPFLCDDAQFGLFACVLLVRGHWLMDRCGFCFGRKNCRICHASTKSRSCNNIFKVHWCHGYLKVSSWHSTSILIMQRAWTHTPTEKFPRSMFRKEGEPAGKTGRVWFAKSHHSSAKVYVPAKCQTSGHKSELSPFTAAS